MDYIFLNDQERRESKGVVFDDTLKVYKIQISVSINKVLLEYSHPHLIKSLWLLQHCKSKAE